MTEFDKEYAKEQIRRSQHAIRRMIKYFFLNSILKEIDGPSIDIGCGAGQLLQRLPTGSIGFEINPYLVNEMKISGLNIALAKPTIDETLIDYIEPDYYSCLVMSHILEHFSHADQILRNILKISI